MIGEFRLNMSEVIQVLVGQEGGSNINARGSGGGGGTFVVRDNSMPLIIAGGGGGGLRDKEHERCNANVGTTGNAGYTSWPGGSNGNGAYKTAYGYSGRGKVLLPISLIEKAHSNISSSVSAVKSYEKIINTGCYEIIATHTLLLVD